MNRPVSGEYVTIIKSGEFDGHKVKPGDRAKVVTLQDRTTTPNHKRVWAVVDLIGAAGNTHGRVKMPLWWLRPRSVLDDLAEI